MEASDQQSTPADEGTKPTDDSVYTHPDTGEQVEIPQGSEIERDAEGNILFWRNPPAHTGTDLHPDQVEGYEAKFDRVGTHRRVMAHVSDEVDITKSDQNAARFLVPLEALGARNTVEAIAFATARDENTPGIPQDYKAAVDQVENYLNDLEGAGLIEKRADGTYVLTADGRIEGSN